jgi:hypothetical protein
MGDVKITYTIPYGSVIRIGYKAQNSASPYTYLGTFPNPSQSPYTFSITPPGVYDVELTTICPNCSGSTPSDPIVYTVNVAT